MRTWTLFALAVVGVLGAVAFVGRALSVPSELTAVAFGLVVAASGPGAKLLADRRRSAERSNSADSVERDIALRAAAHTLPVALLAIVALGTWLALDGAYRSAALSYVAVVLVVVTHWVNYAIDRRRTVSETGF